jgi:RND family efflux transporter MFP subunit
VNFEVEAFPNHPFTGKVAYISPAVDQATRTFAIEVMVDNADRLLKPGFFAKGSIDLKRDENVMAAPDDSVSTLAGVSTVYVIENGKARQQVITLGAHQDKQWEVVTGLKGDEVLATSQLNQLATGMAVTTGERGPGRGQGGRGAGGDSNAAERPAETPAPEGDKK